MPSHGPSLSQNDGAWTQLGVLSKRPLWLGFLKIVVLLHSSSRHQWKVFWEKQLEHVWLLLTEDFQLMFLNHVLIWVFGDRCCHSCHLVCKPKVLGSILHFFLSSASFVRQPLACLKRVSENSYLLWQSILRDTVKTKGKRVCAKLLYLCPTLCHPVKIFPVAQMVKNLPAMKETWVQSLGQEDPLEKGMAIHSSILAWRIPWMEEPRGLQSTESERVRHDWGT